VRRAAALNRTSIGCNTKIGVARDTIKGTIMDFKELQTKWTASTGEIRKGGQKELLSECEGVAGALTKFTHFWGEAEKLVDPLLKKLTPAIAHAENTAKELAGVFKHPVPDGPRKVAEDLKDELAEFVKTAKGFKTSLAKFDSQTA
jgi:hypothetical protein